MNKFLQISNIVLLVAVAVLFILYFNGKKNTSPATVKSTSKTAVTPGNSHQTTFRIAYFELDSVEAKYKYYNEVKNNLIAREKQVQNTLSGLQKRFESRLKSAQEKGASLSQNEQATIQRELEGMQSEYAQKERSMREDLIMERLKKLQAVNERIQKAAKEIAEDKGYEYVLSKYESGENNNIYYSNSDYNITDELIEKLNTQEGGSQKK